MTKTKFYETMNRTPALSLALRAWVDMVDTGHCSNYIQIKDDHRAIVIEVDDLPVGIITFDVPERSNEIGIKLGYVLPDYRGRGLYNLLWAELVAHARLIGVAAIVSATYLDNVVMRKQAASQGRVEKTVTLDFLVPH